MAWKGGENKSSRTTNQSVKTGNTSSRPRSIKPERLHKEAAIRYGQNDFKQFTHNLYDHAHIKATAALIRSFYNNDVSKITWGDYQVRVYQNQQDTANAPTRLPEWLKNWQQDSSDARNALLMQENNDPVSFDDVAHVPKNRCALLDAAVQKCFTAGSEIPMEIRVKESNIDGDPHRIRIDWQYDNNDKPVLLYLTMVCPK